MKAFVNELFDETRHKAEKYIETLMAAKSESGAPPSQEVDVEPKTTNLRPDASRLRKPPRAWLQRRLAIGAVAGLACLVAGALLVAATARVPSVAPTTPTPELPESSDRPLPPTVHFASMPAPVASARIRSHSSAHATRALAAVAPPSPPAPVVAPPPPIATTAPPTPERPHVKIIDDVKPKVRIVE